MSEKGFEPLANFIARVDADGVAKHGWFRWRVARLRARLAIKWWLLWNRPVIFDVSPEAMLIVAQDKETLEAITKHQNASNGTIQHG